MKEQLADAQTNKRVWQRRGYTYRLFPQIDCLPASLPNTPSQCLACFVAKHPLSMPYHLPISLFKKHQPASLPRLPLLVLLTSYHCKSGRKMVSTFYCIFREWITTVRKWSPNPLQEGFLLLSLFGLMGLSGVLRILFFVALGLFHFFYVYRISIRSVVSRTLATGM